MSRCKLRTPWPIHFKLRTVIGIDSLTVCILFGEISIFHSRVMGLSSSNCRRFFVCRAVNWEPLCQFTSNFVLLLELVVFTDFSKNVLYYYSETWWNRNTVHSDLNFKSPVFSLIIFVKNHCTFRIPTLICGPNTLITVIIYLRKPVMIRSIKRVFTYMWISIGSKGKRIESVYRSVYISTPVISDHW